MGQQSNQWEKDSNRMRIATIKLTQGKRAIVDSDMFECLNQYTWCACRQKRKNKELFYASTGTMNLGGGKRLDRLHWYVIGKPLKGFYVDHINGDTLDNRRQNLRIVTNRENCQNNDKNRAGGLPGASYDAFRRKWKSTIQVCGKNKPLGRFETKEEAHLRYMEELKKISCVQ